jgi:uncharacterized protein (TIGR02001 family)
MLKLPRGILYATLLLVYGFVATESFARDISFTGDITGVSTYVWRGVKQNNGTALQSTADFAYGALSVGLWMSSIDFGGDTETETDPYVSLSLPTGAMETSIGVTIYSYDLFSTFNSDADAEYELFANAGTGALSLSGYFVPDQSSTKSNLNDSQYWLELSINKTTAGADLSAKLGYGTYSSKFLTEPNGNELKDPVTHLVLSAAKTVNKSLSVNWNYSIGFDDAMEDIFWLGCSFGF